jgi:hypothetical protein
VHEAVFVANGTRTIFGTYMRLQQERAWNPPADDDLRRSKVVCLDQFFGVASSRVSGIAWEAGIPVVTVDCLSGETLVGRASGTVVSESFLRSNFPDRPLEAVFDQYLRSTPGLVDLTFGDSEIWYGRRGTAMRTAWAYAVEAVDTCCAGDGFRAGIVFGLLKGWDDPRIIDFASAPAGIICMRSPGALCSPSHDEVAAFQRSRRV